MCFHSLVHNMARRVAKLTWSNHFVKTAILSLLAGVCVWPRTVCNSGADNCDMCPIVHRQRPTMNLPLHDASLHAFESTAGVEGSEPNWQGKMRRLGVKRALVRTQCELRNNRVGNVRVIKVLYFSKYETDCAQIRDARSLEKIRASGLKKDLEPVAIAITQKFRWAPKMHMGPIIPPRTRDAFVVLASFPSGFGRHAAAIQEGQGTVEFLDNKPSPQYVPFMFPLPKDDARLVRAVLDGDEEEVEERIDRGPTREELTGALGTATTWGDTCMVRLLVKGGADVNASLDLDGTTPLIMAVQKGYVRMVEILLQLGANVNAKNRWGQTPLFLARASQPQNDEIVRLLEHAGARTR
jgi:Ankyrin repeats (3 copies)